MDSDSAVVFAESDAESHPLPSGSRDGRPHSTTRKKTLASVTELLKRLCSCAKHECFRQFRGREQEILSERERFESLPGFRKEANLAVAMTPQLLIRVVSVLQETWKPSMGCFVCLFFLHTCIKEQFVAEWYNARNLQMGDAASVKEPCSPLLEASDTEDDIIFEVTPSDRGEVLPQTPTSEPDTKNDLALASPPQKKRRYLKGSSPAEPLKFLDRPVACGSKT